jgi:metal-responsive CopG/Arc/MetJ family transcriptional regulator
MGRPKLKEEDKKGKLGISLSKELIKELDLITNNKSQFIVSLIEKFIKDDKRRT